MGCQWVVTAPFGQCPKLSFSKFSTEANYDFIEIYDGLSTSSPVVTLSGSTYMPAPVTSTQATMLIRFSSDDSNIYNGVAGQITFQSCRGSCSTATSLSTSGSQFCIPMRRILFMATIATVSGF